MTSTKPQATLEQRGVSALDNPNSGASELSELVAETELAIVTADETGTAMRMKAADVLATPTPREAHDTMAQADAAELTRDRLRGILPKLKERYAEALKTERRDRWASERRKVEAARDPLSADLADFHARVKAEQADLSKRIKAFNADADAVNALGASIEEWNSVDTLDLPDYASAAIYSERRWGPPKVEGGFAASFAQSMVPPTYDPARWSDPDVRQQRRDAIMKEQQRIGEFYQEQTAAQEERQNEEEAQRFTQAHKRG
jgi:hypothetical protein